MLPFLLFARPFRFLLCGTTWFTILTILPFSRTCPVYHFHFYQFSPYRLYHFNRFTTLPVLPICDFPGFPFYRFIVLTGFTMSPFFLNFRPVRFRHSKLHFQQVTHSFISPWGAVFYEIARKVKESIPAGIFAGGGSRRSPFLHPFL